jgi:enamine deaminase RidA (YjgF/YER057c/UK114 family)
VIRWPSSTPSTCSKRRGARSAVGMAALPMQIAVEVETIIQVRD